MRIVFLIDKRINCLRLAQEFYNILSEIIIKNKLKPHFVTILVGNNKASSIYVATKKKQASLLNIKNTIYDLPNTITTEDLINLIDKLNNDNNVDGILVQLPLPSHLNKNKIIEYILPSKDIDGLHSNNIGKLIIEKNLGDPLKQNQFLGFAPATAMACIHVLNSININLSSLNTVIIGRSNLVGLPLFHLFNHHNATVSLLHKKTKDLIMYTKYADVLVVAAGQKNLINNTHVKRNVIILDVGINTITQNNQTKIVGDCDINSLIDIVKYITPVPNGIGRLTVPCMLSNVVKASMNKNIVR